jgi:hypothetical protein
MRELRAPASPGGSTLPFPLALLAGLVAALVAGAAAAAEPRLSPDQLTRLLADAAPGCRWQFVGARRPAPDEHVERWRARDCDAAGVWNLLLVPGDDDRLAVTVLLPGTTRQPASVQRTATLAVLARAGTAGCDTRRIVDTAVVVAGEGRTMEHWRTLACGERRTFHLTFEANEPGAARFAIAPTDTVEPLSTASSR